MKKNKDGFNSNFGFLMACLGLAVGLGNLWSFPYKLGTAGGFAFLLIYLILTIFVGYPLMLSEIALGRKSRKAAVEAYRGASPKFAFNGILQSAVPFFLISFYCTFGGYIVKYLVASIVGLFDAGATLNSVDASEYFVNNFLTSGGAALVWAFLFLLCTLVIVIAGVSGGIEKFCKIAMPVLFFCLIIMVIRSCTLEGAAAGLSFLFKPDFSVFTSATSLFQVIKYAGSQMFFSLSIGSACLIAYGSYLDSEENLKKNVLFITIGDTLVAILAGMAIMPAVFSFGLEAGSGPSLLFTTMTTVFQSLGLSGRILAFVWWLLIFFAALSSYIGMMEGSVAAMMDAQERKGKKVSRFKVATFMALVALVGNTMTT